MSVWLAAATGAWGGLTGQWTFDGNHNDSVGSNNGTFVGTETYASGFLNQAVALKGSSYLNLGASVLSTSAYTKAAWIKRTGGTNNNIFSGNDTTGRHAFWVPSGTGFSLAAGHNGAWTTVNDSVVISSGVWTHVAVTYDVAENGGTLRLYRNGRLAGGTAVATNVAPPNGGAAVVGAFDNANNFVGQLDDVRLWNNALTAAEIEQVYRSGQQSRYAVYSLVPEAADYEVVYELPIPNSSNLGTTSNAVYSFNNAVSFTNGLSFDRVAYYLELGPASGAPQWVFTSMDQFTRNAQRIGVPSVASGGQFQRTVANLNIYASGVTLTTGTNLQTGNIEFWGYNYATANAAAVPGASASVYDFGDELNTGGTYGSMQIHNYGAAQTIFAYNHWGSGSTSDLGLGNATSGTHPDWTFIANAATYTNKTLLVLVRPQFLPVVAFTDKPSPLQLYPRNLSTGLATVNVNGAVTSTGSTQIAVSVNRADVAYTNVVQSLIFSGGSAPFAIAVPILAELADYDFQVYVMHDGSNYSVATADDVVAGDVFLINGQSNAEAGMFSGSANGERITWVRSFGFQIDSATTVQNDLNWYIAEGDAFDGPGAVGQWGLRMGRVLVESNNVPVAIINHARGGQAISYFPRNDANPEDLNTNYGQMLYRVRRAGLDGAVRGILWYQGENDIGNADVHETGWLALYQDWLVDFPSTGKVYVCQLHVGCGVSVWTADLRDRQRRWPDTYGNIEVMSTTGLPTHDGCHYAFDGYRTLGEQLARLVRRDLYGVAQPSQIAPPNIEAAYFTDDTGQNVAIVTRNLEDQLTADSGVAGDFRIEGLPNKSPQTVVAAGNIIQLSFTTDISAGTGLSYSGHTGGAPFITNAFNVGLLSFHNRPILSGPFAAWLQRYFTPDQLNDPSITGPTADPDGDGFSNEQEFLTGTDPTDSASLFGITAITQLSTNILITWQTGPGKTNALERSSGTAGSYSNNFAAIFTVTNTVGTTTNYLDIGVATNSPARYYRVRLVP